MFWEAAFRQSLISNGATSRPNQGSGSPVKFKFAVFFAFLGLVALCVADSAAIKPLSATQIEAWLIGGVPNSRLMRLVRERGLAGVPSKEQLQQLQSA